MGNAGFGRFIMDVTRHQEVRYERDESKVARAINNFFFHDLEELSDEVFELKMFKKKIKCDLPIQIGFSFLRQATHAGILLPLHRRLSGRARLSVPGNGYRFGLHVSGGRLVGRAGQARQEGRVCRRPAPEGGVPLGVADVAESIRREQRLSRGGQQSLDLRSASDWL